MFRLLLLAVALLVLSVCILGKRQTGVVMTDEKRLTKFLADKYERVGIKGRPVLNYLDALEVKFGLSLQSILDLDHKRGTMTTLLWYNMEWHDILLQWNPSDFGNTESVRLRPWDIYVPDITPYNGLPIKKIQYTDIVVYSDGTCNWVPIVELTTTCAAPDTLASTPTCNLKFGSWTYDGHKLNLTMRGEEMDLSTYTQNPGLEIVQAPGERHANYYACCPEPYIDITYTIEMRYRT